MRSTFHCTRRSLNLGGHGTSLGACGRSELHLLLFQRLQPAASLCASSAPGSGLLREPGLGSAHLRKTKTKHSKKPCRGLGSELRGQASKEASKQASKQASVSLPRVCLAPAVAELRHGKVWQCIDSLNTGCPQAALRTSSPLLVPALGRPANMDDGIADKLTAR